MSGHVFLTGFMGAGKTTVGRLVAERLGMPFVDLDAVVEDREGRAVSAIFAESGEEAFRCAETDALGSLAGEPPSVVACGGGIVLRDENRGLLRQLGRVFYLSVSAEEALARVGDATGRPLLAGDSARMATTLLDARRALYSSVADETIDTVSRTPVEVADVVVTLVTSGPPRHAAIRVAVPDRPYDVIVGRELLGSLGKRVAAAVPSAQRAAIVTDSTVRALLGAEVDGSLQAAGLATAMVEVPPGEGSKSWQQASEVLDALVAARLERGDVVLALGGGVVGDLAGFCASVYLRGVRVVQVPTTLLAQVDSSIGGKTGVDLPGGKNLAGAFWQPALVVSDTSVLGSLPDAEWRSGLAEVAKSAVLAGAEQLRWLEADAGALLEREPVAVDRAVEMCARFKGGVVASDEREGGARECLNLGHTLGHAIERVAGYGVIPHGVAVAEGMRFAAAVAVALGVADEAFAARQRALLDALGLCELRERFNPEALRETMGSDKKVRGGRIRFVLACEPGRCDVREVDADLLARLLGEWAQR